MATSTTGARTASPATVDTPVAAPPATSMRATGEPSRRVAPARTARPASSRVTVPMPPRTTIQVPPAPGSRHMLCTRRLCPEPGDQGEPVRPGMPSVTAYIATTSSEANPNRSRYSIALPRTRLTNASRSAGRM